MPSRVSNIRSEKRENVKTGSAPGSSMAYTRGFPCLYIVSRLPAALHTSRFLCTSAALQQALTHVQKMFFYHQFSCFFSEFVYNLLFMS